VGPVATGVVLQLEKQLVAVPESAVQFAAEVQNWGHLALPEQVRGR